MQPSLPFDTGVALGLCTLSEDSNSVMWNGAEVFDVTWDHVSITEAIVNPVTHPALDPNHKTHTITIRGSVDVLDGENLFGIDTRQGVVCQVLGEDSEPLLLKGRLSPFEPSLCWAILPDTPQFFELQFQLDSQQLALSDLSQVDFYVHSLDCDLLATVDVSFESMDTWQELVPGFDVMIENVIVGDGRWEYTVKQRVQGQELYSSITPGTTKCEVVDPRDYSVGQRIWGIDVLYDRRTVLGENHAVDGGVMYRSTYETTDDFRITALRASARGHLDISKIEYTFALSTRKRIVPLTITNIPLP
ncbi:MAG: hypothetical protein GY809_11575 [Planctomycetes bacterium]|nr:hypothetical protein [Planctomycetota bacterium]